MSYIYVRNVVAGDCLNVVVSLQSFQVEGPQNRKISLFIGNTIGRFLRELSKAEKQPAKSAIMSTRPISISL